MTQNEAVKAPVYTAVYATSVKADGHDDTPGLASRFLRMVANVTQGRDVVRDAVVVLFCKGTLDIFLYATTVPDQTPCQQVVFVVLY